MDSKKPIRETYLLTAAEMAAVFGHSLSNQEKVEKKLFLKMRAKFLSRGVTEEDFADLLKILLQGGN